MEPHARVGEHAYEENYMHNLNTTTAEIADSFKSEGVKRGPIKSSFANHPHTEPLQIDLYLELLFQILNFEPFAYRVGRQPART